MILAINTCRSINYATECAIVQTEETKQKGIALHLHVMTATETILRYLLNCFAMEMHIVVIEKTKTQQERDAVRSTLLTGGRIQKTALLARRNALEHPALKLRCQRLGQKWVVRVHKNKKKKIFYFFFFFL